MTKHYVDPSTPAGNTRSRGNDGWGKRHVSMQLHYERMLRKHKRDTQKYNKYLEEYAAWKKANGKGGTRRRHRKHRSTRRR